MFFPFFPIVRGGSHKYIFDDSLRLVTNVHLSQILDFLVPQGKPMDPQLREGGSYENPDLPMDFKNLDRKPKV